MIPGKRVRLRAVERTDLPKFLEWLNDSEVIEGLSHYLPLSSLEEEKWFDSLKDRSPEERPLAIEARNARDADTWQLIGNTSLFNLQWANRSAEFGIFIGDKAHWDKGYGTEALELMLRHAFNTLNLHRIHLRVYATNGRARRSYEKAGFVHEGTMREAGFKAGRYVDVEIMSILRHEWKDSEEGA